MKKFTLITLLFTGMVLSLSAQTDKGKWLVGASIGVYSDTEQANPNADKVKTSEMYFQPSISYFISDDLAVGLLFASGSYKMQTASTVDEKSSSMLVAPSLRYYMPIGGNHFKFFGQLLVPFGTDKTTVASGADVDVKTQLMGVNLMPGFAFFPSSKISIEMSLGSIGFQTTKTGDAKSTNINVSMLGQEVYSDGFTGLGYPTIGFKLHLGK